MSKSFLLISVIKVAPWRKHSGKLKETGGKTQLKDFELMGFAKPAMLPGTRS